MTATRSIRLTVTLEELIQIQISILRRLDTTAATHPDHATLTGLHQRYFEVIGTEGKKQQADEAKARRNAEREHARNFRALRALAASVGCVIIYKDSRYNLITARNANPPVYYLSSSDTLAEMLNLIECYRGTHENIVEALTAFLAENPAPELFTIASAAREHNPIYRAQKQAREARIEADWTQHAGGPIDHDPNPNTDYYDALNAFEESQPVE